MLNLILKTGLFSFLLVSLSTSPVTAGSMFDTGVSGSSSALNQLETISGGRVDRSSTSYSRPPSRVPSRSVASTASSSASRAKVSSGTSSAMTAFATGMMVIQLLDAMDSSQQAQADLARAQAEAERQRLIEAERQRKERLVSAGRLRDSWDQRDQAMSESLGDAFGLPGDGDGGTDFFGVPSNPNPAGVSAILKDDAGQTGRLVSAGEPDVPMPISWNPTKLQEGILKQGAEYVESSASETLEDVSNDLLTELLPDRWKHAKEAVEHVGKVKDFVDNLFEALGPKRLVGTLVHGSPQDYNSILSDLDQINVQAADFGGDAGAAYKAMLNPQEVTTQARSYFTGKFLENLLSGSM